MMPTTPDPETPRASLGLARIEKEGRIETANRAQKLVDYVVGSTDPTHLQRIQKLDLFTLRSAAALLATRLRLATVNQKPAPTRNSTKSKPPSKQSGGVKTSGSSEPVSKPAPRARRQESDWRRQRTTRPSYTSRARRLGLLIAAVSSALAAAALRLFH